MDIQLIKPANLKQELKALPKVELHLHLEGCINIETVLKLATKNHTKLSDHILQGGSGHFATFDDFVQTYYAICNAIVSAEDFCAVIADVIEHVQENNIIYCEVSWTPFLYLKRGLRFDHVIALMNEVLEIHEMRDRIKFIIDTQRDHGLEVGEFVYSKVFDCQESNIVGIGLTGQEQGFSASTYKNLYQSAKDKGFGCTAHAGEYGSAADVWQCVQDLGATRIGHGIRACDDAQLMAYLLSHNIHLEVCPTSNVKLERVTDYLNHPLKDFWKHHLNFGLNSDDPGIFEADLTEEYLNVMHYLGLHSSDIKKCLLNSVEASFTSAKQKKELAQQIMDHW